MLALVAAGLTACGSDPVEADGSVATDDSSSAAPSPTAPESPAASDSVPPGTPECSTLWQDGATIEKSYAGCVDDDGQFVKKDTLGCSSGQTLVRYDDRFYGVLGGSVHEASAPLDKDRKYRATVLRCRA